MPEFQIAVSVICHSAIRFVDHLGENMVTHGEGRNFMVFSNLAFFYPVWLFLDKVWLFFLKRCLATLPAITKAISFSSTVLDLP